MKYSFVKKPGIDRNGCSQPYGPYPEKTNTSEIQYKIIHSEEPEVVRLNVTIFREEPEVYYLRVKDDRGSEKVSLDALPATEKGSAAV